MPLFYNQRSFLFIAVRCYTSADTKTLDRILTLEAAALRIRMNSSLIELWIYATLSCKRHCIIHFQIRYIFTGLCHYLFPFCACGTRQQMLIFNFFDYCWYHNYCTQSYHLFLIIFNIIFGISNIFIISIIIFAIWSVSSTPMLSTASPLPSWSLSSNFRNSYDITKILTDVANCSLTKSTITLTS